MSAKKQALPFFKLYSGRNSHPEKKYDMDIQAAKTALKKYFGYDSFRDRQAEVIQSVLDKRDTVVIMPTGGGKSICYQIPALILPGLSIVVSPLIALMRDQVEGLKANGVAAAFINSSMNVDERRYVFNLINNKELKLLYISPEKLLAPDFLNYVATLDVNLIAVDEAHCVSTWGHDFRPEYGQLSSIKALFPYIPVIALTATADKVIRYDISKQLALREPRMFVSSFDRPNISLSVQPAQKRLQVIISLIRKNPDNSGIIYCLSRKTTEMIAGKLKEQGFKAEAYHAGLSSDERTRVQDAFITDEVKIVCATIAFGMGIDKSNVRWVVHYNLPKNIEGYYQEIGRSGRDGLASEALLFYSIQDVMILRSFNEESSQREILGVKLQRMQDYAEAVTCRRKILLSYFNQTLDHDCGNCDVCNNPPKRFDGTILAQKALSACLRLHESVAVNLMIDVLRGSHRHEIIEKQYDKIKTWGAGSDVSFLDWQQYILQMLHQGLFDLAYDENLALKATEAGREVLFNGRKIELVRAVNYKERKEKQLEQAKPKTKAQALSEGLFDELKQLRLQLAKEQNMPAYVIFPDSTLKEMAEQRPENPFQLLQISGVGEAKLEKYGAIFLKQILDFKIREKDKGSTYLQTLTLLQEGLSIEQIAKKREINPVTVYSHISHLYEKDSLTDISMYINQSDIEIISKAIAQVGKTDELKPIFDQLEGQFEYSKIRLTIAYLNKREGA